ncbi:MAG: phage portal protein [Fuerstiella sp.]
MSSAAFETFTASTSPVSNSEPEVRTLAARSHGRSNPGDTFAAAASGLGSTRELFYGGTGRSPNTRADETRRKRALTGGSGNRHMGALDLWTEREISRHVRDNSEVFEGMVTTWATEVIQCGFTLQPKSGDDDFNAVLKEALFGHDGDGGWFDECDARGMMHFWELLALAEETEVTDGDHALALDPEGNDGRGTVAIIEADRILTPIGYSPAADRQIHHGIECDKAGKPVKVFIAHDAPQYPHCTLDEGDFFDIFDPKNPGEGGIVLSITPKRYSATRRTPWLAQSVRGHDEIEDVFTATRIAIRNQACRSTYTKIKDYEAYMEWLKAVDPSHTGVAPEDSLNHSPSPGDHVYTNPGEEIQVLESTQPGTGVESFMKMNLRFVGLPIGMGLEEIIKLFDRNFSASRLSLQGSRRRYKKRQRKVKRRKVTPVTKFAEARLIAVGDISPPESTVIHYGCKLPTWPYIEPQKDAKADEILRNLNVKSSRTISEERGYDYDTEKAEIEEEGPIDKPKNNNPQQPEPNKDEDE